MFDNQDINNLIENCCKKATVITFKGILRHFIQLLNDFKRFENPFNIIFIKSKFN
tara:strand:- start:1617 stop:1781 length:165 start_codon:yes stop_codon:yes gene_type:complete